MGVSIDLRRAAEAKEPQSLSNERHPLLRAVEGKTLAEFQQKTLQMVTQRDSSGVCADLSHAASNAMPQDAESLAVLDIAIGRRHLNPPRDRMRAYRCAETPTGSVTSVVSRCPPASGVDEDGCGVEVV